MRTLITGGTGALGLELALLLAAQGDHLVLVDVAPRSELAAALVPTAEVVGSDLTTDVSYMAEVLRTYRPDRLFHLAGLLPGACERDAAAAFRINVQGTFNVLEACRQAGTKAVTIASSTAVIGVGGESAEPASMYGTTKACAELLACSYHGRAGLDIRGVRLRPIVGLDIAPAAANPSIATLARTRDLSPPADSPGMSDGLSPYGRISKCVGAMLREVVQGRPYTAPVPETAPVYAIYRGDAARALAMLGNAPARRLRSRIYNVPTPIVTIGELAVALREELPAAEIAFAAEPTPQRAVGAPPVGPAPSADTAAQQDWGWHSAFTPRAIARDVVARARADPALYGRRIPRPTP